MNIAKKITKIAKSILSDIILKDDNAFKKYLEDHPNYREGTVFIVDGVERKAPSKKKKTTSYKEDELNTIGDVFNGAFRALEGKGYKIDKLTPEQTEKFHNILNGILEKNKIRPLSKEEFKEMFTSEINKRFPKKEEKKEVSPKQESPNKEDREKLLQNIKKESISKFNKKSNRKKHFENLNESLEKNGFEKMTENEYKTFLKENAFQEYNGMKGDKRLISHAINEYFCNAPSNPFFRTKPNGCFLGDLDENFSYALFQQLRDLTIEYPVIQNSLNFVKENNSLGYDVAAEFMHGRFDNGKEGRQLSINSKCEFMKKKYIPYIGNEDYYAMQGDGRYMPLNSSDLAEDKIESFKMIITHEIGHNIFHSWLKHKAGINKTTPVDEGVLEKTQTYQEWVNHRYESEDENGDFLEDRTPTLYSESDTHEYFAECFALYVHGKKQYLDEETIKKLEEVIKWSSAMN